MINVSKIWILTNVFITFQSTIESSEVEKKVSEAVKQVLNNDLPWEPDQLNSLLQSLDETIHEKLKALNKYYKFLSTEYFFDKYYCLV